MPALNDILSGLRTYLEIAFLLGVSFTLFRALDFGMNKFAIELPRKWLLNLGYCLLFSSILFPMGARFIPNEALLRPSAQVWSSTDRKASESYALITSVTSKPSAEPRSNLEGVVLQKRLVTLFISALMIGLLIALTRLAKEFLFLRRFLRSQHKIRKLGSVSILACSGVKVPFSAWIPGKNVIGLPIDILGNPELLSIAIKHEMQHHRQWDTRWVHVIGMLKAFYFWNPAVYLWGQILSQFQEFACDEALIRDQKVSPQVYGRCLVQAAKWAVGPRAILVGTTSMAASTSGRLLKRRINMMFNYQTGSSQRWLFILVGVGTLVITGSAAFASRSVIQDRAMTLTQVQALVNATSGQMIPITVNELVLAKLNRFIGTPEGRKFVKEGMARMPIYQAMIERKIKEYDMPSELIATALYESGFENSAVSPPPYRAAGIWQFVPQTARNYGLVVNDKRDERLNPEMETDAAMRYLTKLNGEFQDWRLALKAYNEGERRVETLIKTYNTRDPWVLERANSKESYLSGVMAMMIILKNPTLIE